MASLLEIQAGFAAALRGDAGRITAEITSDRFEARERLQIYRNNSRAMFEAALERTYAVLRQRVGEDYFRQLVHSYRERWPSRSGDLHWVGQHFPQHVAETQAGTGYEWLAELAMLEWACESALVAEFEMPVGVAMLAGIGPDEIGVTRLRLQPSLRCIAASFPVLDVWRANQPGAGGQSIDLSRGAQCILVSCDETGLKLCEIEPPAFEFVRALQGSASLGEAVDGSGLAPEPLARTLGMLFAAGLVTAIACPTEDAKR